MKKLFVVFALTAFIAVTGYGVAQYVNANGVTAKACNSACE
ncbi:MAG: hypothetical protein ACXVBE_12065 [Bdellovibrionota bacterium]